MKAIITKILLFFRDLFLHLHVVVKLRVGRSRVSKGESIDDQDVDEDHTDQGGLL